MQSNIIETRPKVYLWLNAFRSLTQLCMPTGISDTSLSLGFSPLQTSPFWGTVCEIQTTKGAAVVQHVHRSIAILICSATAFLHVYASATI